MKILAYDLRKNKILNHKIGDEESSIIKLLKKDIKFVYSRRI